MRQQYQSPHPRNRIGVIYLGESKAVKDLREWGRRHGVEPSGRPDDDSLCAVIDEDIWQGRITQSEDSVLREAHETGLPCLSPEQAWPLLVSAVSRT